MTNTKMKKAKQQGSNIPKQEFIHDEKISLRINKYLTSSGFCSRREADRLVADSRVYIDGILATMGAQVYTGQQVTVDGVVVEQAKQHTYIALNKPVGITCTVERDVEGNIADFLGFDSRIFPIGRLDKPSQGLILLTSDGDIVNKILRAENNHEKEYIVRVNKPITPLFLKKMSGGVEITNTTTNKRVVTNKCKVSKIDNYTFSIILTQGLNRQIRKMCSELGYSVTTLTRVRIMNILLGNLQVGEWRYLTQQELTTLQSNL